MRLSAIFAALVCIAALLVLVQLVERASHYEQRVHDRFACLNNPDAIDCR